MYVILWHHCVNTSPQAFCNRDTQVFIRPEEMTKLPVDNDIFFGAFDSTHCSHNVQDKIMAVIIISGIYQTNPQIQAIPASCRRYYVSPLF